MKQIAIVFATVVVICFVFAMCIFLLRVPICKGKLLPFFRQYVQWLCPPADLYEGLIDEIVDFNNEYTYTFKIKYIGPYNLAMEFDHIGNFNENCHVKAKIDFYIKDKLTLSRYMSIDGIKERSWCECDFVVPEDLPIEEEITCKIKIVSAEGKCKTVRLLLSKSSEE